MTSGATAGRSEAFVLDASAVLALLQEEPGAELVEAKVGASAISAVNWSEVIHKSLSRNLDVAGLREDLEALGLRIADFTAEGAEATARLGSVTAPLGLSLGDRACLALAGALGVPAMTSDTALDRLDLDIEVQIIR